MYYILSFGQKLCDHVNTTTVMLAGAQVFKKKLSLSPWRLNLHEKRMSGGNWDGNGNLTQKGGGVQRNQSEVWSSS
jgi:hypothetical protein